MALADQYAEWIVKNADKRGTPEFDTVAAAYKNALKPTVTKPVDNSSIAQNFAGGVLKGASQIGATLLAPVDAAARLVGVQNDYIGRTDRRQAVDDFMKSNGVDTDSFAYGTGKIGTEIAGTAGVGWMLGNAARAVPYLRAVAPAIESGGFNLGTAATASPVVNSLLRIGGGAVQGGATAGLVDPSTAGTGAVIGAAAPGVVQVAGYGGNLLRDGMQSASKRMMQSALKPTIAALKSGQADTAVNTLLAEGINATPSGVNKLRGLIDDLNTEISNKIAASGATVNKQAVLDALDGTRQQFANQVSPTKDLSAIDGVASDFLSHPLAPSPVPEIPVQMAQDLKQGTYRVMAKKYGQMGSAETEAQKALARGLKEEIATAVPEVAALNAKESALLATLSVADRRAMMELNKNPMGLSLLAQNPAAWAAFMADRSAAFKSVAARLVNAASNKLPAQGLLPNSVMQNGLLGAPSVLATSY